MFKNKFQLFLQGHIGRQGIHRGSKTFWIRQGFWQSGEPNWYLISSLHKNICMLNLEILRRCDFSFSFLFISFSTILSLQVNNDGSCPGGHSLTCIPADVRKIRFQYLQLSSGCQWDNVSRDNSRFNSADTRLTSSSWISGRTGSFTFAWPYKHETANDVL